MALSFDDVKAVLTGGAGAATTSPLSAMRANTKITAKLLEEETTSNKRLLKLTTEIRDSLSSIRKGGTGGLDLGDLVLWGFLKKSLGRLKMGTGRLAGGLNKMARNTISGITRWAVNTATTALRSTADLIKAAGSPLLRNMRGLASASIRTAVAGAARTFKWIGNITSGMVSTLRNVSVLGGNFAKTLSGFGGVGSIAKVGGAILKKVLLPVQVIFSLFDAFKGWKNADEILGKPATLKGKVISSIGSVLNGITFGLTDGLTRLFGGENLARSINNGLDYLGEKIYGFFNGMWQAIPDWDTVKASLPDVSTLVTDFVTLPSRFFKNAVDMVTENFPDVGTLAASLGTDIWNSVTGLFDSIKGKITGAIDGVKDWWNGTEGGAKPAMDQNTKENLDRLSQMSKGLTPLKTANASLAPNIGSFGPTTPSPTLSPEITATPVVSTSSVTPWAFTEEGSKFWIENLSDGIRKALGESDLKINPLKAPGAAAAAGDASTTAVDLTGQDVGNTRTSAEAKTAASWTPDITTAGAVNNSNSGSAAGAFPLGQDEVTVRGGVSHREIAGGSTYNNNATIPAGARAAGNDARAEIVNTMMDAGLSRKEASAIAGNMYVESKYKGQTFNPNALGDNGSAYGLMQWRHGRRQNLNRFAAERGLDPSSRKAQALFAVEETKRGSPYADTAGKYGGAVGALEWMRSNPNASIGQFTDMFMKGAERPNSDPRINHINGRIAAAEAAHNAPNDTSVTMPPVRTGGSVPGDERFKVVGNAKNRGLNNVDPRLTEIMRESSKYLPEGHRLEMFSGFRPGDKRNHGKKIAGDFRIIGPDGKELPNYQSPETFREYEKLAQNARKIQMERYPELANKFRWGGYFSGGKNNPLKGYGGNDAMHFDLASMGMAAGSWENGLSKRFRGKFDTAANPSVGMGDVASYQLPQIGKPLMADASQAALRQAVQKNQAGFNMGLGYNIPGLAPTRTPAVGTGLDSLMAANPPPSAPVAPVGPVKPVAEQASAWKPGDRIDLNSIRTMDEMDVLLWNTSVNG